MNVGLQYLNGGTYLRFDNFFLKYNLALCRIVITNNNTVLTDNVFQYILSLFASNGPEHVVLTP